MTSSPAPTTSRRSPFFPSPGRPELALPLAWFALLLAHGATLGLTDDEAYYWVLAGRPALGYAFHPPMVAWLIAAAERIPGIFAVLPPSGVARLPAAACSALVLALALRWLRELGGAIGDAERPLLRGAAVLVAYAGFFAFSWMIVPDLPLFFGLTLAFTATWRLCEGKPASERNAALALGLGICLATLSKFSAILGAASAAWLLWRRAAPRARRAGLLALAAGLALAAAPILVWNASHRWASILYQIRDRHEGGGGISWIRYGRFWAIELLAGGPALLALAFFSLPRAAVRGTGNGEAPRLASFVAAWVAPAAAVFCVQPLFADFKPHWAFVVWWPAALWLAARVAFPERFRPARLAAGVHLALGAFLLAAIAVACHVPLLARFTSDPRQDVTNDLYGWPDVPAFLAGLRAERGALPEVVLGARYQTASQAAFALRDTPFRVSFVPRDGKSLDEWPDLRVTDGQGPAWPRLLAPVLFVTDNRYDAPPEFPGAECGRLARLDKRRGGAPAKWIEFWKCAPVAAPSGSTPAAPRRSPTNP